MEAGLLRPVSPRWTATLAAMPHDIYHLPEYVEFAAQWQLAGEPIAFVADEPGRRMLVPLIIRSIPSDIAPGLYDATSSRLFPGPLIAADPGVGMGSFAERAVAAFVETLRHRRIVTAFIRMHPLLVPPLGPLERTGALFDHGESVSIDLALSPEEAWRQTRQNHRRDINTARRLGYIARIDERFERLGEFADIYCQSMDRLGASEGWRLSYGYFDDLRRRLPGHVRLCVVERNGELAAGAILTETSGIVEYHLAGTADAHVPMSPSKLLIDFARRWAKSRGNRWLHLAGSLRRGDPLNHFKLGFSSRRHPLLSWRLIADPATYSRLVGDGDGTSPDTLDGGDAFFPAYRRPVAVTA